MIDLHIHTTYSGGLDNLTEVLELAEKSKLSVISITDNNTCEAYQELKKINYNLFYSGKIIPGCEFSTILNNVPIELIGYNIDVEKVQHKMKELYLPKEIYNIYETNLIIDKCIQKGIKIDYNNLHYDPQCEKGRSVVFEKVKENITNKKFFSKEAWNNKRTFFLEYISNPSNEFFVDFSELIPSYREVVRMIKECGGLVFMPHIFKYGENSAGILKKLLEENILDGIEAYYPYYSEKQTDIALKIAKEYKLYISGGSDSHGTYDSMIGIGKGNLKVKEDIIKNWASKSKTAREEVNGDEGR